MNEKEAIAKLESLYQFIDERRAQLEDELANSDEETGILWCHLIGQLDEISIKLNR
jgi:hypothetical protein